jgi:hypothetical protein
MDPLPRATKAEREQAEADLRYANENFISYVEAVERRKRSEREQKVSDEIRQQIRHTKEVEK